MSASSRMPPRRAEFGNVHAKPAAKAPAYGIQPEEKRGAGIFDCFFIPTMSVASLSFCAFVVYTSLNDPNYYSQKLITSLMQGDVDPVRVGATDKPPAVEGLPVPTIVRAEPLTPDDYQIVMIFEGEAILATDEELMRVKVGSVLPGLGEVKEIVASGTGGTVNAEFATLKSVAN